MATNTQTTRKSLLKSSISIKSIQDSVSGLSKTFSNTTKTINKIVENTGEGNKFMRKLIANEQTFFTRRREQVLRREKEDVSEASSVGGAIKRRGKAMSSSTKGFLGRILDFFGIVMIGWLVNNLPNIIKGAQTLIENITKVVNVFSGFFTGMFGIFDSIGEGFSSILQTITPITFEKDKSDIKKGFDDAQRGLTLFENGVDSDIRTYLDPKSYNLDNWEDVIMDEEEEEEEEDIETEESETTEDTEKPEETTQEKVEVKVEPKTPLVMDNKKKEGERVPDDDPKIANDTNANLEDRFDNGYIPQRMINGKENPDYAEYKEWLNAPGGLEMFKDGGIIKGKSHAEGGENINVEGGEAIVPKKSVDKLGPEFINRIIEGNANKITKLRAGRSLLEKLVEQHKEENDGLITYDEYNELKAATIGKLKEHLRSLNFDSTKKQPQQLTPKKQDSPKIDVNKSKINSRLSTAPKKKKKQIITIPIPSPTGGGSIPMPIPLGGGSKKSTRISTGLSIGDLQSLMLSET
tara:strand:- start:1244 stop:2809 length:1566 start_codon:yes stop_codon:yes gene_type:complete